MWVLALRSSVLAAVLIIRSVPAKGHTDGESVQGAHKQVYIPGTQARYIIVQELQSALCVCVCVCVCLHALVHALLTAMLKPRCAVPDVSCLLSSLFAFDVCVRVCVYVYLYASVCMCVCV